MFRKWSRKGTVEVEVDMLDVMLMRRTADAARLAGALEEGEHINGDSKELCDWLLGIERLKLLHPEMSGWEAREHQGSPRFRALSQALSSPCWPGLVALRRGFKRVADIPDLSEVTALMLQEPGSRDPGKTQTAIRTLRVIAAH